MGFQTNFGFFGFFGVEPPPVLDILLNYYFVLYERISLPSIEMEDFSVWVSKAPFRKRRRRTLNRKLL